MENRLPEADWKLFRKLRLLALGRFCQRVLDDVTLLTTDSNKSSHERYLVVYRLIQDRDEQLAAGFNDPKRSMALVQLARIRAEGLLSDAEFAQFSEGTRSTVQVLLELRHS